MPARVDKKAEPGRAKDGHQTEETRIALLAAIVDSSDDAVIAMTPDGIITSWNHGAELIYGYLADEIIGKSRWILTHTKRPNAVDETLRRIRSGGRVEHYETLRVRKDGTAISVSLTVSPILDAAGNLIGVSSISRDVTEQRQASQYARSLIEASFDPLVIISPEGKITDVNEATIRVTGVDREGLVGADFFDYFTEPEKAREGYKQVFDKGDVADYPLTIRAKDGRLTDVLFNASVYKDASGKVLGVSAVARDVTEQKQASQYARSLIEASLDPLVIISPEGKITDINEATIRVTGVDRQRLVGADFFDYFTEPEKAREGYKQVFDKGDVADYPLTIRAKDGRLTDVLFNASVYKDASGKVLGVSAVARDVTEQKRVEAELAEQQTREIERLAELERFQKLTVGRELKMIELKKEIAELVELVELGSRGDVEG